MRQFRLEVRVLIWGSIVPDCMEGGKSTHVLRPQRPPALSLQLE